MRIKERPSIRKKMMKINGMIALCCFLLYGGLFLFSIHILIEKYINSDMDFILQESSDNLQKEFLEMEETVLKIRESDVMMDFLEHGYVHGDRTMIQSEFSKITDINNWNKQWRYEAALVEEIYLFRESNECTSVFYYQMGAEQRNESIRLANEVRRRVQSVHEKEAGFIPGMIEEQGKIYVVCPVLDEVLVTKGQLIFCVKQQMMEEILAEVEKSENSFWAIYDSENCVVEGNYPGELQEQMVGKPLSQTVNGEKYRLIYKSLGMGYKVVLGIPKNHAIRILYDTIGVYFWMILLVFVVGIAGFRVVTDKLTRPLREVSEKMKHVTQGNLQAKLPEYNEQELYEISTGFNHMTEEIHHLIIEVYEKQLSLKDAELNFLQSQLNPHFVFNVLNAIGLQAKMDGNQKLSQTISTFSKYMQAKMKQDDTGKVRVRQELEYVKCYLEIQQFRYGETLSFEIEVEEKVLESYIQKFCIQLIVENAILHGIGPKMGKGRIRIRGYERKEKILIEIEDDGVGFPKDMEQTFPLNVAVRDEEHNRIGLNSIHEIIQLRYGTEYGLQVRSEAGNGSVVTICMPFDRGEEN